MAADNSPLSIRPIAIAAFVAIVILIGLKFVFDSYYVTMFEEEEYRKVGSVQPSELLALRAAEAKSFAAAPIPLDRAMQLVARGRAEPMPQLKNGGITPEQSKDKAALVGWAQTAKLDMSDDDEPTPADSAAPSASALPAASGSAAIPAPSGAPAASSPSAKPSASAPPSPRPSGAPALHP